MLQMKLVMSLGVAVSFATALWAAPLDTHQVEWLLKDAFEEEYVPISKVAIALPEEVRFALDCYHAGNYRKTIDIMEKLRALHLPDGRLDFITFVLAESYRKLDCTELARKDYYYVINNFPASDKTPPSYYRLLAYAIENDGPGGPDAAGAFE